MKFYLLVIQTNNTTTASIWTIAIMSANLKQPASKLLFLLFKQGYGWVACFEDLKSRAWITIEINIVSNIIYMFLIQNNVICIDVGVIIVST